MTLTELVPGMDLSPKLQAIFDFIANLLTSLAVSAFSSSAPCWKICTGWSDAYNKKLLI